jgi:magnesium chelatase family protein
MIVNTIFRHAGKFELGEIEVKLLPGVPALNLVGLPDASMKECGIKLKSALRSSGLEWPQGHQIIVNLRPSYLRKQSSGVDLAIALGFLAITDQLPEPVREALKTGIVYGEIALNGRVFAPHDVSGAMRAAAGKPLLTGHVGSFVREGVWWELKELNQKEVFREVRTFDWNAHWREPELPSVEFSEPAAQALALAVHMDLSVLVAGPQGTGKTTWAKALYALTKPPDLPRMLELADLFGDEVLEKRWRPCEQPHHTVTPQAMVGGGKPLQPGVISRAHGGLLIMDEFLEFHPYVLESLREPIERGVIEIARSGERMSWPARFQLVGTTNLCPCGKLNPNSITGCNYSLTRCRSICFRLSGPLMDRFDVLLYSHGWIERRTNRIGLAEVKTMIGRMRAFAADRDTDPQAGPDWLDDLGLGHRRRKSIMRVARGLADMQESKRVLDSHVQQASDLVLSPMDSLRRLFG